MWPKTSQQQLLNARVELGCDCDRVDSKIIAFGREQGGNWHKHFAVAREKRVGGVSQGSGVPPKGVLKIGADARIKLLNRVELMDLQTIVQNNTLTEGDLRVARFTPEQLHQKQGDRNKRKREDKGIREVRAPFSHSKQRWFAKIARNTKWPHASQR